MARAAEDAHLSGWSWGVHGTFFHNESRNELPAWAPACCYPTRLDCRVTRGPALTSVSCNPAETDGSLRTRTCSSALRTEDPPNAAVMDDASGSGVTETENLTHLCDSLRIDAALSPRSTPGMTVQEGQSHYRMRSPFGPYLRKPRQETPGIDGF